MIVLWGGNRKAYSDIEVVNGLQERNGRVEEWFYNAAKRYFDKCFNEVFFNSDCREEIFQSAFIKLWTEIENGRIKVDGNVLCRQQRGGEYMPMTCNLTTFLMAFAKTEYRELVRNVREESFDEFYDSAQHESIFAFDAGESDADEMKSRIVDECIQLMSPACIDIITQFYYHGKSLDEIMETRGGRNSSKDGLKTAKNKCMSTLRERVLKEYRMCNL